MKIIGTFLGIVLGAVLVLAIGGGALVLLAYGVGWVINLVMGLDSFQVTALSLGGIFVFIILAERVLNALMPLAPGDFDDDEEFDDEYDGEFDDEYDDEMDGDEIAENIEAINKLYAGIPRWRRPTKNLDFSKAKPDGRCPCGSGRKYKNCHGTKQTKI
ncbi:MAG: SEC-C domain-containing protein [Anaerolineales bacterium]|nr:SEC-C domain-containing protein [Anaerolineales bacterium]